MTLFYDHDKQNRDRILVISKEIDNDIAGKVIESIMSFNTADNERDKTEKGFVRTPIRLIINTPGGSLVDGFAIISAMHTSETPIYTVCYGSAYSMGFAIFVAGHKRFAHKLSTFMYHEASTVLWGKLNTIKKDLIYTQKMMDMYDDIVLEHTNITSERLAEVKNKNEEWFLFAEDALKLGMIDELFS